MQTEKILPLKALVIRTRYFFAFTNKRLIIAGSLSFIVILAGAWVGASALVGRPLAPPVISKLLPTYLGGTGKTTNDSSKASQTDSTKISSGSNKTDSTKPGTTTPSGTTNNPTGSSSGSAETPNSSTPPPSSGNPSSNGLKPYPRGLITTDPTTINLYPYATYVTIKSVGWQDVESSPGNYNWSMIDSVMSATLAKNPNAKFRIRLYAGRQAPTWLNNVSGTCVQVDPDSANGASGCVPRFWTDAYIDRYETLMNAFAAKYEPNAAVVDFVNSACSTIFAESFILGADAASVDRLWQAGLTEAGHRNCLNRTTAKMMQVFPTSRVTVAGHDKWQIVEQGPNGAGDGKRADSWDKERDLLNSWRTSYGSKLVVEEHGLGPTDYCAPGQNILTASSFYCWFASLPGPKGLQFTLNGGSMEQAATNGVNMGACFLEYAAFQAISMPRRQEIHNQLVANCN